MDISSKPKSEPAPHVRTLPVRVGRMARPAVSRAHTTEKGHGDVPCLEWDDHRWRRQDHQTNEESANRSTTDNGGDLASGAGSATS
jgi:putative transposase